MSLRFLGQDIVRRLKILNAGVMELADVTDSKSVGLITRVGSSPTTGTKMTLQKRCHPRKTAPLRGFSAFKGQKKGRKKSRVCKRKIDMNVSVK